MVALGLPLCKPGEECVADYGPPELCDCGEGKYCRPYGWMTGACHLESERGKVS